MPINLPSLQSRAEDIPLLIKYFKQKVAEINGVQEAEIDENNDLLYSYNWPGNVREVKKFNRKSNYTLYFMRIKKTQINC